MPANGIPTKITTLSPKTSSNQRIQTNHNEDACRDRMTGLGFF